MKAYKGFNKDMTCRGFQYEEGKEYQVNEAKLCKSGFHACIDPIDCMSYYGPSSSVYHEVELEDVCDKKSEDSKICGRGVEIGKRLTLSEIISIHTELISESTDVYRSTLDYMAHSTTQGNRSHSTTQGNWSYSVTLGDGSHSAASGKNSIAAALGDDSLAKAALGNWIVLAEYDDDDNLICVKSAAVDGEKIKADTWYKLENGEFVEVNDEEE